MIKSQNLYKHNFSFQYTSFLFKGNLTLTVNIVKEKPIVFLKLPSKVPAKFNTFNDTHREKLKEFLKRKYWLLWIIIVLVI